MSSKAKLLFLWVCLLGVCLLAPVALAQTTNASIVGLVTDSSGGAIPGATVTVTNTATLVVRTVTTNEVGAYNLTPLIPGTYEVKAGSSGFKTDVHSNVILQTGAVMKVDFKLEVGAVTETIEVSSAAPMLQTQEASVAGVVTTSQLERIPVNGRNFTRLIVLMAGSSDVSPNQSIGSQAGMSQVSMNGQRQNDNNFTIDGVDNNIMYKSSGYGAPPMDAIQEFRVATNNSAEYGRSAGANVNIAIKSGTRDLHGSVYEYLRNDKLDANEFFANRQNTGKVPYRQNQYGVALGGPVYLPKLFNGRDNTFWFFSWEGYRRRRGNTTISTTPIAEQRTGDFSMVSARIFDPLSGTVDSSGKIVRMPFQDNKIPTTQLNPGMKYLTDLLMPLPNRPGQSNNYVMTDPTSNDRDIFVVRGDRTLGAKDNVWGRFLRQRVGESNPTAYRAYTSDTRLDSDNFGVGWNHVFSPTTVLEAKYGYNHPNNLSGFPTYKNTTRPDALTAAHIQMFDLHGYSEPVPSFNAIGQFSVGGGGGETIVDSDHQFDVKVGKMMGRHSLRMGASYVIRQMDAFFANPTNGSADFYTDPTGSQDVAGSGQSFATLLLGYPSYIRRGLGIPNAQGRQKSVQAFFQDDWRITDKLTLNLGIRYEGLNRPYDAQDKAGNLLLTKDPQTGAVKAQLMWAGVNPLPDPVTGVVGEPPRQFGYGRSLMQSRWLNLAPRVGIAWQMNPKTVIRTGFGMFYDTTFMQELNDLRKFWPYLPQQEFSPNRGAVPDLSISDVGPAFASTQAIGGWPQDPNNRTPYSQQWNFTIQRQLAAEMTMDVGYVGSSNKHQIGYVGWNDALSPGPGDVGPRRLLASSGFQGNLDGGSNVFSSEYNALQLRLNRRFSKGLQIMANYTWGKSMDDQSSLSEAKYENFLNRRADWSRSSWDIKQAFKFGYVYDLPFGRGRSVGANMNPFLDAVLGSWSLEGIVQLQSGAPVNVKTGQDRANIGKSQERPDVIRNPNLDPSQRTVDKWFDTSAFVLPQLYTWGNAGAMMVDADGRIGIDASLAKKFRLTEKQSLEFRSEFFNIPNHPSFSNPNGGLNSSTFGKITGTAIAARQIQFALRYAF